MVLNYFDVKYLIKVYRMNPPLPRESLSAAQVDFHVVEFI